MKMMNAINKRQLERSGCDESTDSVSDYGMSRKRYRYSTTTYSSEEDEDQFRARRHNGSISLSKDNCGSSIQSYTDQPDMHSYNPHMSRKPAEMFRTDLISAMKLADSIPLHLDEYHPMTDSWKNEWEKGVQVPVNITKLPQPTISRIDTFNTPVQYTLPKKYVTYDNEGFVKLEDSVCRYDLDDTDTEWLNIANDERRCLGESAISELNMEKLIEQLESHSHTEISLRIQTQQGLGIEFDENVICDVCRSPDSEDSNEMVFCDGCDICVHQACYGIVTVPDGSWLCRTCIMGIGPRCLLCPNEGGAMKTTKTGTKWCHVSCALWIPEVSITDPERMEPIARISQIPPSRWSLICSVCRERSGACIQCCVKQCKTAYHVTCAFKHNLEMKMEGDGEDDDVKFRSYCLKHTRKRAELTQKDQTPTTKPSPVKKRGGDSGSGKPLHENPVGRQERLRQLENSFYQHIKLKDFEKDTEINKSQLDFVFEFWKIKRKAMFNNPLLLPKAKETELQAKAQEDSLSARLRMFVHLRQDMERVRNLCYMVIKREKLARVYVKHRIQIFTLQSDLLLTTTAPQIRNNIINANNTPDIILASEIKYIPVLPTAPTGTAGATRPSATVGRPADKSRRHSAVEHNRTKSPPSSSVVATTTSQNQRPPEDGSGKDVSTKEEDKTVSTASSQGQVNVQKSTSQGHQPPSSSKSTPSSENTWDSSSSSSVNSRAVGGTDDHSSESTKSHDVVKPAAVSTTSPSSSSADDLQASHRPRLTDTPFAQYKIPKKKSPPSSSTPTLAHRHSTRGHHRSNVPNGSIHPKLPLTPPSANHRRRSPPLGFRHRRSSLKYSIPDPSSSGHRFHHGSERTDTHSNKTSTTTAGPDERSVERLPPGTGSESGERKQRSRFSVLSRFWS